MQALDLYLTVLPVFALLIAIEALWFRVALHRDYGWRETLSNLGVATGQAIAEKVFLLPKLAVYLLAWDWRVFDITMAHWTHWVALFVAVDFAFYCLHRASHRIRWLWAQHSVHHSANQLTLSVSYRLGWTNFIGGQWLFFVPVVWLGFPPQAVLATFALNLVWQFVLHTEAVRSLGPLEWILNTPSHHRVHHAADPAYRDRNFGGVFIVFDRLFGTFTTERRGTPIRYGLVHPIHSRNPMRIAFAEWLALARDLRAARTAREALGFILRPPGWQPDPPGPDRTIGDERPASGQA